VERSNHYDFTGRHAVITGGAAGIGLAIAQRLAAGGARLTLWDRDANGLEQAKGMLGDAKVHTRTLDIGDEQAVSEACAATMATAGVDILINSAGITGPNATVWEYLVAGWDDVMRVNVRGTFLCCRALVPQMRERGYGRIVNIASVAGKEGNPNASAYSASKAAVIGLTKSLGKELAQSGVTANCITPAAVRTAIFEQMTQQHIDYMLSKIPMNRFGDVQEIAALVAWLASSESSFSTGAVFDISGGRATY
jgi:2-dehydro-3-deoxy-L-rhamnonate dehydrogenase (NAD+)